MANNNKTELSQVLPHTPWARSFWAFSPFLNHLQKVQKVKKRKPARRKKNAWRACVYGCTTERVIVVQLNGLWLYD